MGKFTENFLQTPHHVRVKKLIYSDSLIRKPVASILKGDTDIPRVAIKNMFDIAIGAGKEWAEQFLPPEVKLRKEAQTVFNIDLSSMIERVIRNIGDRATKLLLGSKGEQITQSDLATKTMPLVRLEVVESYMKSALQTWANRGIKFCKRVELDDIKTCPVCRAINLKEYSIADLLQLDAPLTHDTHEFCRGAFTPIINNISKLLEHYHPEPVTFSMDTKNATIDTMPIEFRPWMEQFTRRINIPFKVKFISDLSVDYKKTKDTLLIRPDALWDEDPREIITKFMADEIPSDLRKQTVKDYRDMLKLGLVIPPIDTKDDRELFTKLYQQYLLNQLDDAYEVIYFKTFFDGTLYGKG